MKHFTLLAASILLALSSAAVNLPRVYSPDLTVTKDDIGKVIAVPFYLEMPEGGNFTNIQMTIQFPEGLHPIADQYGTYAYEGDDITRVRNLPTVSFVYNLDDEINYPTYSVVGVNLTKSPQYANPNQFVYINEAKVEIRREPLQLVATLAGSPLDDNRIIWSSSDESVAIVSSTGLVYGLSYGKVNIKAEMVDGSGYATCIVETYLDGDMDHNARLDIDDVNRLVNRLLE